MSALMPLEQLEEENRRLKGIIADQGLGIEALEIVAEGILRPAQRREALRAVREHLGAAE